MGAYFFRSLECKHRPTAELLLLLFTSLCASFHFCKRHQCVMRMEGQFVVRVCLVLLQMWDLSASQRSRNNGSDPVSTAAAVHFTAEEKTATVPAVVSRSPSSKSTTNTGHLVTAGPAAMTTQPPVPATGAFPSSPAHDPTGPHFHAGSFLGGMMLALVLTLTAALAYRLGCSSRTVRYRAITIDQMYNGGTIDQSYNCGMTDQIYNCGTIDQMYNSGSLDQMYNSGTIDQIYNCRTRDQIYNCGTKDQIYNVKNTMLSYNSGAAGRRRVYSRRDTEVVVFCRRICSSVWC
ncbi:hypothetical protein NFI96_026040 [Prochilodus magdalenae]|nr:hypothetical protein NFI96_026040 [Prochilodus magdalenae]